MFPENFREIFGKYLATAYDEIVRSTIGGGIQRWIYDFGNIIEPKI